MSLATISELWNVIKPNLENSDIDPIAESVVNYLIDEGFSPAEIKQAFKSDRDIKEALEYFLETPEDGLYLDEEEEDTEDYSDEDYEV